MNYFEKLYKEDQYHIKRWEKHYTHEEFLFLNKKIRIKLERLIKKKKKLSGRENFICAMIFHHGFKVSASKKALKYIVNAQKLGYKKERWVEAAIIDRLLQLKGKPQKYGTQIVELKNGKIKQYKTDKSINDKRRIEMGLPKLKDLKNYLESKKN